MLVSLHKLIKEEGEEEEVCNVPIMIGSIPLDSRSVSH